MIVECTGVHQEFVTVYIIQLEINLNELQLQERQHKKAKAFFIQNEEIAKEIKACFLDYQGYNMTLSDYFGRTIIYAQKQEIKRKNYILTGRKNMRRPLIIFKVQNRCHINQNIKDVKSNPLRMSLDDILILHGIKEKFDMDNRRKLEEKYHIQILFYKLYTRTQNYKQKIFGRTCSSVPGARILSWKPQQIINIGESYMYSI